MLTHLLKNLVPYVRVFSTIFYGHKKYNSAREVALISVNVNKHYFPHGYAWGRSDHLHHVPGVLFPISKWTLCICHSHGVPIMSLDLCIIQVFHYLTKPIIASTQ